MRLRAHKNWKRDTARTKGTFLTLWRASQEKLGEMKMGGRGLSEWCCLTSNGQAWWLLLSLEWLNPHLLTGSKEWIPYLALFVCAALLYLVNCLHLSLWVFSLSPFWYSLPSHMGKVSGFVVLSCLVELNHSTTVAPGHNFLFILLFVHYFKCTYYLQHWCLPVLLRMITKLSGTSRNQRESSHTAMLSCMVIYHTCDQNWMDA